MKHVLAPFGAVLALSVAASCFAETDAEKISRLEKEVATLKAQLAAATAPAPASSRLSAVAPEIAAMFEKMPENLRPKKGENHLILDERVKWAEQNAPKGKVVLDGVITSLRAKGNTPGEMGKPAYSAVLNAEGDLFGQPVKISCKLAFADKFKNQLLTIKEGSRIQVTQAYRRQSRYQHWLGNGAHSQGQDSRDECLGGNSPTLEGRVGRL